MRTGKLAVIGGGAAGLVAAIAAGEWARENGVPLQVSVFERDDRVGRSILATGNGRCNFSNAQLDVAEYHNSEFVGEALGGLLRACYEGVGEREYKFMIESGGAVHAFFRKHGLVWREEADGRQYPQTGKASTVVDILRASAAQVGVREEVEREVRSIDPPRASGKPFTLQMSDGVFERADAVVIACGGRMLEKLEPAGVAVIRQRPVLGPLRVVDAHVPIVRELDNIRVRCSIELVRRASGDGASSGSGYNASTAHDNGSGSIANNMHDARSGCHFSSGSVAGNMRDAGEGHDIGGERDANSVIASETGELLFRKYGVSGICVFNLSRFALPGDELRVNLLGVRPCDAEGFLFARRKMLADQFPNLTCADMLRGLLLPRVADAVLKQAGLAAKRPFAKADVSALAKAATAFPLEVAGIGDPDICQVRRGGLDVGAFDGRTMEARDVAGLYAAGEALDVDGPCGGYNLHWAWASGMLAGLSAAKFASRSDDHAKGGSR